jgi:molybdopterin converting factor small subunit
MQVTVHYHALLRERTGLAAERMELAEGATTRQLLALFSARYPALQALLPSLSVAINDEFAGVEQVLGPGDRVDLLPPFG